MKKLFIFFIASILFITFSVISFVCADACYSNAEGGNTPSINIIQKKIPVLIKDRAYQVFKIRAAHKPASMIMISGMTLQKARRISKCAKSQGVIIDKKSTIKATPFEPNIDLYNSNLTAAGLHKIAAKDIYSLSIAAKEHIHKTSLISLQIFLL